jgi:hypothetical protein
MNIFNNKKLHHLYKEMNFFCADKQSSFLTDGKLLLLFPMWLVKQNKAEMYEYCF